MKLNKLSLAMVFLLPFSLLAQETTSIKVQFKDSYQQYQTAVTANNKKSQMKYALQSYQLGQKIYPEFDVNLASLAFNLAALYNGNRDYTKANELLLPLLNIYEQEYGKDSLEHIDLYFALAEASSQFDFKQRTNYYLKILNISDRHKSKNQMLNAHIQLDSGIKLLSLGSKKSKVILDARDYFIEHLAPNDTRVVKANFYAGKYYLARKRLSKAITSLEANIPIFEALDGPTHPLELTTRAFLIGALERKGNSEEATKHCIAIGAMTPWDDAQDQTPIYRIEPKYPKNLARKRKSGYAIIEFTVSTSGFVQDPKVLQSEGGKGFEKSALTAMKQWRYAPKFEKGIAVAGISTVRLDFTIN